MRRYDLTRLGPRGWAVLIPGVCVALSLIFLKSRSLPEASSGVSGTSHSVASSGSSDETHASSMDPAKLQPSPGAEPEFPEWARRPSPLDALITAKSPSYSKELPSTRRPAPLKTWTDAATDIPSESKYDLTKLDRYSPFSENYDTSPPVQQSLAALKSQVQWPDHNYAARSPGAEETTATQPAAFATHPLNSTKDSSQSKPQSKPVGASLRSQLVPSSELFIRQPGMAN